MFNVESYQHEQPKDCMYIPNMSNIYLIKQDNTENLITNLITII